MSIKVVKVEGLNLNRLLTEISNNKIEVIKITREKYDEMILEISSKQYKKLIDLKISTCYNINVIKTKPKFSFGTMLLKRCGLVLGIIVASWFLSDFCSRIWSINISFDKEISGVNAESIQETLTELGVTSGKKLDISTRDLEKQLLKEIENSAMVVVERSGINLNVFVKARELKDELSSSDIVAAYDGVIKEINHSSGILIANIGEAVVKGQVLIASGVVGDVYNEAIGDIKAKVRISGDAIGSINTTSYQRSGRFVEVNYYEIFGKTYYFNQSIEEAACEYAAYEVEVEEKLIFSGNLLPLKKCVARVYELTETSVKSTNSELITKLKEQAYITAKNQLVSGAAEEFVSYDVFNDGEYYRVVCNIETTISIGKRVDK